MKKQKAFTMAEAILVMTILGIIATIMITTLKPAQFKEKALAILAKKAIYEIDAATTQILVNNSTDGTMLNLFIDSTDDRFAFNEDYEKTKKLYEKYLTFLRKEYVQGQSGFEDLDGYISQSPNAFLKAKPFYLKDGTLFYLGIGEALNLQLSANIDTISVAMAAARIDEVVDIDRILLTSLPLIREDTYLCNGSLCSEDEAANCNCVVKNTTYLPNGSIFCQEYDCTCSASSIPNPTPTPNNPSTPSTGSNIDIKGCSYKKGSLLGMIFMDINGAEEPNTPYQDQFYIPIGKDGIEWDQFCMKQP